MNEARGSTTHAPLVSVVMPSLNQGDYIEAAIESVISQDYPRIELIVRDGGSTDGTIDALKRHEGRLRWVSERDRGQSDAIVKGFAVARGSILAWLNSDDLYLPGAVSRAVKAFGSDPCADLVYGRSFFIDEAGERLGEYPTAPFDRDRLARFNFICQPSTFFKKTALDSVGGIDTTLSYSMDYDLWLKFAARGRALKYIDEHLSCYRLHPRSKTVDRRHALESSRECMEAAARHMGWYPPNRVFVHTFELMASRMPYVPGGALTLLAAMAAALRYVALNRGLRAGDVRELLSPANLRKMLSSNRRMDAP